MEIGHLEIVKLLLNNGVDFHADNDKALCMASENGQSVAIELLLNRGADNNALDNWGYNIT